MKYNLANKDEKKQAMSYFMTLANKKALVEVKKLQRNRTLRQNAYLHLIIGYFGVHFGYTLDEAKIIYKDINRSTYMYEKRDRKFYRSSADLDTAEMTKTIDRFRQVSAEQGCPLPPPTDLEWLRQIENEIERNGQYV